MFIEMWKVIYERVFDYKKHLKTIFIYIIKLGNKLHYFVKQIIPTH